MFHLLFDVYLSLYIYICVCVCVFDGIELLSLRSWVGQLLSGGLRFQLTVDIQLRQFIAYWSAWLMGLHSSILQQTTSWWLNQPIWKICVNMGIFPENYKLYLKPPPRQVRMYMHVESCWCNEYVSYYEITVFHGNLREPPGGPPMPPPMPEITKAF